MKKIKKLFRKLWNNKVFRTFLQTFIGTFAAGYALGMDDKAMMALLTSALSAAVCAAMNVGSYESR